MASGDTAQKQPKLATKIQCWGTTTKQVRCKRMIDPMAPGKAVMDGGGVYYCAQHAKQADMR